jgi:methylisocitrate lyase
MATNALRTPGERFRQALKDEAPFGAINAYHAPAGQGFGFKAFYLSGGGVAAGSLGLPDLGINTMDDVLTTSAASPMSRPAAAGRHRHRLRQRLQHRAHGQEPDQGRRRRPAHRGPGGRQALRPSPGQGTRQQRRDGRPREGAADAKTDAGFFIMARTDALAVEGMQAAIDRACACVEAGADMIFPEAMTTCPCTASSRRREGADPGQHHRVRQDAAVHHRGTRARVDIVLYPLSAYRAMNKARP